MQQSAYTSIIKKTLATVAMGVTALFLAAILTNCASKETTAEQKLLHGSISYPFYETRPLGKDPSNDKFIIRSAVGNTEYTIEIPGAAKNYDIEIPLASLDSSATGGPDRPRNLPNPVVTDREMLKNLPNIEQRQPANTAFLDKAFGVSNKNGPRQSPSYTLGLAKVNKQYKRKNYEYALIEINNMLAFYPNSQKLHKMKGTVYAKMRNYPMAEKSWIRAFELNPRDRVLKNAIQKLQRKIKSRLISEREKSTLEDPLNDIQPVTTEPVAKTAQPINFGTIGNETKASSNSSSVIFTDQYPQSTR